MGLLVNGKWHDQWYDTKSTGGKFVRQESAFRHQITKDGSTPFVPEAGRYHLYVSLACPWAHRALIMRRLKKLEDIITVSVVDPVMLENGWEFGKPGSDFEDPLYGNRFLSQIYTLANPKYTGRVTVPVLWDRREKTIVNNESSEMIREFNHAFEDLAPATPDFYPGDSRPEIDEINDFVYAHINNGVYKCGFATEQDVYEQAFDALFAALDRVESRLADQRFLVGDTLTEADIRLFTTLIRFDAVYVGHFKCNQQRIADYPNLSSYLKRLHKMSEFRETVNFDHIKRHYYISHRTINPTGIVPKGPSDLV